MAFPQTKEELADQGYELTGRAACRGCGRSIDWYKTPKGKSIPIDPGTATPHWETCERADDFRKPRKGQNKVE